MSIPFLLFLQVFLFCEKTESAGRADCYASNSWSDCWYNFDVSYIELTSIYIEYMDGTTYRLYSDEVEEAFAEYPVDPNVDDLGYNTGFTFDSKNEEFEFTLSFKPLTVISPWSGNQLYRLCN